MIDDLRHYRQEDAFRLLPEDVAGALAFALLAAAFVADRLGLLV